MSIRLLLFGSPAIDDGGQCLALPFERRTQLLALLALKRSWVSRAELAALLWPEQVNSAAYANLRKILFRLQAVSWAPRIDVQGSALRLQIDTDVTAFEAALRERRLADALRLRRGELLAGFDDDSSEAWWSWLGFERDRLRAAWRGAALERLDADVDPAEGIELSARLADADPLDEAALRAHMSWLVRGGQSARARQVYREYVDRLARDLGLAPSAGLQALHDSIAAAAAPAPRATTARASADDGFVGRAVELRRIASRLAQDDCRLLTIVGPGGVGKTRLAQRALRQLAGEYPDGAAFIPLDDLPSASDIGSRIARELGIALAGGRDPLEQLTEHLRSRRLLLALDNFEHLAAEASLLQRLLAACDRLRIIVTSRVRLALATEWVMPLQGLPCPDSEDRDCIEAFDAARLFIQVAQRVEPALLPAAEAASIIEICRQVEGLPLALELAATWARVLSCDAIAAELRQGTDLLQSVGAAHPARHASIEVVFDQSWRLLGSIERDVLARLSVFRGGFTAEAARAVAAAALPVLGALADKSLLRKDGARLFMHPLVQQLAALRLGDGEARAATERAHARYFDRLLTQSRRAVADGDRDAMQRVDAEFGNCRLAWRWSIANGATDALAKSAPALVDFCDHRGRYEEGLTLLNEALEPKAAGAAPAHETLLLSKAAHLEYRLDRYAQAEARAARALAMAEAAGDDDAKLLCLKVLGTCCQRVGRNDDARRYFEQALQLAPESVDPHNAAAMYDHLALVEKATGRYDEALRLSLQSLAQHRHLGDVAGEALCLNNLAALYLAKRDFVAAGAPLREGLALCDRHGLVSTRGFVLANLTEVALETDDVEAAEKYARRALETVEATGHRSVVCFLRLQLMRLALRRDDFAGARAELAAALTLAIEVARPALLLAGVICFAELLLAQGENHAARRVMTFAQDHPAIGAPERDEIQARLARLPSPPPAEPDWPAMGLEELVQRVVIESSNAHAALIAALRTAV